MSRAENQTWQSAPNLVFAPRMESAATTVLQGVQLLQQNQLDRAKACFERAMLADPRDALARNCLGIVARAERRFAEAMALFIKAIELQPEFAEAHNNLGNVFRDTGNIPRAAECYRRALAIKPAFSDAQNNLGVALLAQGDVDESVACFDEAIRLQPQYAEAHNNLANAYQQRGELIAAAASFETALQLKPTSPEIHNNLANVLRETGQLEAARQHYEQAIRLHPDFVDAHDNLGSTLLELNRVGDAISAYERAEQLQTEKPEVLLNLGNAYRLAGRTTDALRMCRRVASLEPENFWHQIRLAALCPPAFRSLSEVKLYRQRALETWPQLAAARERHGPLALDTRLPEPEFAWQFLDGNLLPVKKSFAAIFGGGWPVRLARPADIRPRVGIVVTSGHEGLFLRSLAGVIQRLNTARFDVAIVCPMTSEATIRRGLARDLELVLISASNFHHAAETIRRAQFSVLYFWEIGTDATNYFLPFLQLAPIQCTSWGVQVTSGIPRVDYYLGCELVEPPNAAEHYTEQLLLSPTLLTCQTPPTLPPQTKTRSDFGFNAQQHLYVCAQQVGKFHPDFDALIGGILRQDEHGLFVAVTDRYGHATGIVRARVAEAMPDVAHRVVFLPRLEFLDYLQLLNIADVLLDPPHFGGVNSTYDALAIGKPVVTLPSEFHRGRYTAACLKRIGVTETIASTPAEYIKLAVTLASDREKRVELGRRLRQSAESLFRDEQSVREHERLFEILLEQSAKRSPN